MICSGSRTPSLTRSSFAGKRRCLNPAFEEPTLSGAVCRAMDRSQMQRLLDYVPDDALADLRRAYRIRQVGAGGRTRSIASPTLNQAHFDPGFLSLEGIKDEVGEVAVFEVFPSGVLHDLPTRHWLDEVDTAIMLTKRTKITAYRLRKAEIDEDDDIIQPPPLEEM